MLCASKCCGYQWMTYDFETGDLPMQWWWQRSHAADNGVAGGRVVGTTRLRHTHTHTNIIMRRRYVHNMQSPTVRDILIYTEKCIYYFILKNRRFESFKHRTTAGSE